MVLGGHDVDHHAHHRHPYSHDQSANLSLGEFGMCFWGRKPVQECHSSTFTLAVSAVVCCSVQHHP